MVKNRSVPTDRVLPHVVYRDVGAALARLTARFGFTEHYGHGEPHGPVQGAQTSLGDARVQLAVARDDRASPAHCGHRTQSLTVFVDTMDVHYEAARSAGTVIVEELDESPYGERQYGVEDLEGHHWLFSRHVRDVRPEEWGARVAGARA